LRFAFATTLNGNDLVSCGTRAAALLARADEVTE
jgi:hypothetical protein